MNKKDSLIYTHLQDGFSIRQIAGLLECSTTAVQKVRSKYPEQFTPAAPRVGNQCTGRPASPAPSVSVSFRVPRLIFDRICAEIIDRGLTKSEFFNRWLNDRYRPLEKFKLQDRFNDFIPVGECDHGMGAIVPNHNGNLNKDSFICSRCGAVFEMREG